MAGSDFLVNIQARLGGNATSELGKLQSAANASIGKYKELEATLAKSQSAADKVGASRLAIEQKLAKAGEKGDAKGVTRLTDQLTKLKARESELAATINGTKGALKGQVSAVESATSAVESYAKAADKAGDAGSKLDPAKTADGFSKIGGALGPLGTTIKDTYEGVTDLASNLGGMATAGIVGAAAVVTLTAALAAGAVKLGMFAIKTADAKRNLSLTLEAMQGSSSGGAALGAAFADVTSKTGVASDRLLDLSRELTKSGVSAADMPNALRAIATQEAALGSTDGTTELVDKLKEGKQSASDMAKEMESKFGGVVAKRMNSLDSLSDRFSRNIGNIFGGLDIEPVLDSLSTLVDLFDTNTESGQALKSIFESLFGPVISGAGGAGPAIERVFLTGLLWALKFGNAAKAVGKYLDFDTSGIQGFLDVAGGGDVILMALQGAAVGVAAGLATIVIAISALNSMFNALHSAGSTAMDAIVGAVDSAKAAFEAFDLSSVGSDMVSGLVEGIKAGASQVVEALGSVVDGAVTAAKSKLGIKSPSRVFMEMGGYTAEGMAIGLDKGGEKVTRSMEALVAPPKMPKGETGKAASGTGGNSYTLTFNIGGGNAQEIATLVRIEVQRVLDGAIESMGGESSGQAASI